MTRDEIISLVQIKIDEISPFDSGEIVNNSLVDSLLNESANRLLEILPTYMSPITKYTTTITGNDYDAYTGYINLPSNFLKMVSLKMEDWSRPVTTFISDIHPEYKLQMNQYTRGGTSKPVCALIGDSTGVILEYFSVKSNNHTIDKLNYIAETLPENLNDLLIEPLSWMCASIVFQIMDMKGQSELALSRVQEFVNNYGR